MWQNIYDNLIIQPPTSRTVTDLWIPNQQNWNVDLINSLFTPETPAAIIQNPIINAEGQDTLVWKLTPSGDCSLKSA